MTERDEVISRTASSVQVTNANSWPWIWIGFRIGIGLLLASLIPVVVIALVYFVIGFMIVKTHA